MNFKIFSIYVFRSQFQVEISCLRQQKEVEGTFNKDKVSICRAISTDVKIKELLVSSKPRFWKCPQHLESRPMSMANICSLNPNVSLLFHQP